MLLNDNRGSFGMFSRAGRNSAEKYHILARKDEILAGLNKKVPFKDLYSPDDNMKQTDEHDDDFDIFATDSRGEGSNDIKSSLGVANNVRKKLKGKPKSEIIVKKQIKKVMENPSCTKYNPKNEYIWKKTLTGPKWIQSIPKNSSIIPKEDIDVKFYLSHTELKVDGKNFVDLARQTQRGDFIENTDIRIRSIKSSNPNRTNGFLPKTKMRETSFGEGHQKTHSVHSASSEENSKENFYSKKSHKSVKSKMNINMNNMTNSGVNRWVKIQAPDFKKIISREQLDKIYGDKRTIIPFSIPNFKSTSARPIMMVQYDKALHRKNNDNRPKTSSNDLDINYDPHKVLDKINNYKKTVVPNFNLMTSRPNDNDPLPAYMKKIYSRQSAGMLTEKTLKMNNYAEGKFGQSYTSFWPKKSFNKVVNLNLLNSNKFIENIGLKSDDNGGKSNEINDYIQKSMKFYNKNFDDLIKESMLTKFDNVTFKTIKRENKMENGDLEKFLINFEKVDA